MRFRFLRDIDKRTQAEPYLAVCRRVCCELLNKAVLLFARDQREEARPQDPHCDVYRGAASIDSFIFCMIGAAAVCLISSGNALYGHSTCNLLYRPTTARAQRAAKATATTRSLFCGGPCSCRSSARRCSCRRVGACECLRTRRLSARRPPARATASRMVLHARSTPTLAQRLRHGWPRRRLQRVLGELRRFSRRARRSKRLMGVALRR